MQTAKIMARTPLISSANNWFEVQFQPENTLNLVIMDISISCHQML